MFLLVGLGNPGKEYENTRHNVGRMVLDYFVKENNFSDWEKNKIANALSVKWRVGGEDVMALMPETFMNNSGQSVAFAQKNSGVEIENIIVIYDDLDLPLGEFKISFDRGSGGHNGVESIINHLKTKKFVRVRVGISPKNIFGRMKKPQGEKKVSDFVLGDFKKTEIEKVTKVSKVVKEVLEVIMKEGGSVAMNKYN